MLSAPSGMAGWACVSAHACGSVRACMARDEDESSWRRVGHCRATIRGPRPRYRTGGTGVTSAVSSATHPDRHQRLPLRPRRRPARTLNPTNRKCVLPLTHGCQWARWARAPAGPGERRQATGGQPCEQRSRTRSSAECALRPTPICGRPTHETLDATPNTGEGSTSAQSSLTGSSVHTAWLASRPEAVAACAHASRGAKVSTHSLIRRSASSWP